MFLFCTIYGTWKEDPKLTEFEQHRTPKHSRWRFVVSTPAAESLSMKVFQTNRGTACLPFIFFFVNGFVICLSGSRVDLRRHFLGFFLALLALPWPAIFLTTWVWRRDTSSMDSSNRPESRCKYTVVKVFWILTFFSERVQIGILELSIQIRTQESSVADPDPYVFEPPGSGFISPEPILLSSSKNRKKNLDPSVLWLLYDFLSLKNDVNVSSKSNKQKNLFFGGVFKVNDENSRIRIRIH